MEHLKIQRKATPDLEQRAVNSSLPQQPTSTKAVQPAETQTTAHLEPRYAHNFADISVFAPEHAVQRKSASRTSEATEPNLNARIRAAAGSGSPLAANVQSQLEAGIGADLSNVRVHTGSEANQLSHELQANAFTTGNDIYFRQGLYNPNSSDGIRLLAHEATHTVQQANGAVDGVSWGGGVKVSDPNDQFEQAAERSSNQLTASNGISAPRSTSLNRSNIGISTSDPVTVQREPSNDDEMILPADNINVNNHDQASRRDATRREMEYAAEGRQVKAVEEGVSSLGEDVIGMIPGLSTFYGAQKLAGSGGNNDKLSSADGTLTTLGLIPGLGQVVSAGQFGWDAGATIARGLGGATAQQAPTSTQALQELFDLF